MEKYGEIQKDKTVQSGNLNQKSNLHMTYELSDIYHVRA